MNAAAPLPLLFRDQEIRLAAFDELTRRLWLGASTNSQGSLETRLATLAQLRRCLHEGLLPGGVWCWPEARVAHRLTETIQALGLASFCLGQETLTDTVLASLLFHLDCIVDRIDRGATGAEAVERAVEAFASEWRERCGLLDELVEVFGALPDAAKHTRWDLLCGLLRSEGWQEIVRIRRLIERLPDLVRILRALGRARLTDEPDEHSHATVQVIEQATAQCAESHTIHVPDLPGETRGICRSDRIGRMLPAEAMLLGHPRLRLVWHARRAERTLLTYEDDDRLQEIRFHEALVQRPRLQRKPERRLEMGPLLVCVDTSGSMRGGAEAVAKATVLEAVRVAHAQQRPCHVFAFGGTDEVVEMELAVDRAGIERLMRFLSQSFQGGTDICGPLERAIAKLEDERWQLADLLIASDGEFGATAEVVERLRGTKQNLGLRVQGVLIGDRETIGLLEVTDDVFWVRDWRRYGGTNAESPVHSRSLTATYFPGALRTLERRAETVSEAEGAAAVRAGIRGRDGGA
ncbi:MAG TPA: VWA domain-containing protein [Burkholderiales bacterium]|nr:VWA domain-containing protein [Betaproteobacteria bacterium]HQR53457.1 VWA domain-containing protein [Burkholderiales bacterium]